MNPENKAQQGHDVGSERDANGKEAKFGGGIAIKQPVLIKRTHLFCRGVPVNEIASLNCGLCRAIKGERERERQFDSSVI